MINNRLIAIAEIQKTLLNDGISSFLIDGGLLGIIRDRKLITWDWDVEIAFDLSIVQLNSFEQSIDTLVANGFMIKSISRRKYLKINLYLPTDPFFTYSIFGLRRKGAYFVRPRYRYPAKHFVSGSTRVTITEMELNIPKDPESFLEFVYGNQWRIPIKSMNPKKYLNIETFRWNKFDNVYRLINKVNIVNSIVRRLIVSQFLNGREYLFRMLLRANISQPCSLLEIGSSDGIESKIFLESDINRFSIIYEPRETAISRIRKNNEKNILNSRLSLNQKIVVAKPGDSRNFVRHPKGNLSSVSLDSLKVQKETADFSEIEIALSEVLKEHGKDSLLIKMDLEGYEIPLINQLSRLTSNLGKCALLMELHQDKYEADEAKKTFIRLIDEGFVISHIETASHPKPRILMQYLESNPLAISGRRALWKIDADDSRELVSFLTEKHFVYNDFTAEFGFRVIRSVLFTKDIDFSLTERTVRNFVMRFFYKI